MDVRSWFVVVRRGKGRAAAHHRSRSAIGRGGAGHNRERTQRGHAPGGAAHSVYGEAVAAPGGAPAATFWTLVQSTNDTSAPASIESASAPRLGLWIGQWTNEGVRRLEAISKTQGQAARLDLEAFE